jgi:hypothetical protein
MSLATPCFREEHSRTCSTTRYTNADLPTALRAHSTVVLVILSGAISRFAGAQFLP